MLILNKDFKSIQKKTEEALLKAGINNTPGGIARLFSAIINEEQAEFYDTLSVYHAQCFISTAKQSYLDELGKLLNCKRKMNEDDENYRYRITQQSLTLATANYTAIRLAALSVEDIDDVYLKAYTGGMGSFTVYILNNYLEVTTEMLKNVRDKVSDTVAYGINFDVTVPDLKQVEIKFKLIFENHLSQSIKDEVCLAVKKNIINYITNLPIGSPIILNEMTQIVMQEHNSIINYSILNYKINGEEVMHSDQYCESTDKFVVLNVKDSITVY